MIITLNTKEDSKEEIKRVIQMLMRLIDEMPASSQQEFAPMANEGIFGLFDNPSAPLTNNTGNAEDKKEPEDRLEIYDY